jgi:hypothetical protein
MKANKRRHIQSTGQLKRGGDGGLGAGDTSINGGGAAGSGDALCDGACRAGSVIADPFAG